MFADKNNSLISNETYKDNISCRSSHFNSMRAKPVYPVSLIENNISAIKSFPNNWVRSQDEWKYFRDATQFRKRCLFDVDTQNKQIHLRSIDSLTNRHLLDDFKFPEEDYVYQTIGQKRFVSNKRNEIDERSPGDKSYKAVEYSQDFFKRSMRNWRSEKFELSRRKSDLFASKDVFSTFNLDSKNFFQESDNYQADYEQNKIQDLKDDIENVKSLEYYKKAAPLEIPFKVLDLPDKSAKYRPKVTK